MTGAGFALFLRDSFASASSSKSASSLAPASGAPPDSWVSLDNPSCRATEWTPIRTFEGACFTSQTTCSVFPCYQKQNPCTSLAQTLTNECRQAGNCGRHCVVFLRAAHARRHAIGRGVRAIGHVTGVWWPAAGSLLSRDADRLELISKLWIMHWPSYFLLQPTARTTNCTTRRGNLPKQDRCYIPIAPACAFRIPTLWNQLFGVF